MATRSGGLRAGMFIRHWTHLFTDTNLFNLSS